MTDAPRAPLFPGQPGGELAARDYSRVVVELPGEFVFGGVPLLVPGEEAAGLREVFGDAVEEAAVVVVAGGIRGAVRAEFGEARRLAEGNDLGKALDVLRVDVI